MKGFTLIEFILAVAIIGLTAAATIQAYRLYERGESITSSTCN